MTTESKTARIDRVRAARIIAGVIFWAVAAAGARIALRTTDPDGAVTTRVVDYLSREPRIFEVSFPASAPIGRANTVRIDRDGELFSAGFVVSVEERDGARLARIAVFPELADDVSASTRFVSYRTDGGVAWVMKTLLSETRLDEIRGIAKRRWDREKDRLMVELQPGLVRLGEDVIAVLREDFPRVLDERRDEFSTLATVMRERGWEDNFEGVFNEVLWPKFRDRSLPMLQDVGDEIVSEFPLWAISWAYVVETLPFTNNDRVEERVREFLVEKATPIIAKRAPQLREAAGEVMREAAADERTLDAVNQAVLDIGADPRFREAMRAVLDTWLIANPRVKEIISGLWRRPDLRRPAERFLGRLEPDVHRIANGIVLNAERDGINPDLARVLRRKLLREDESWVLIEFAGPSDEALPTRLSGEDGGVR